MNVYGVIEGRLSSGTINGSVTPETSINGSVSGGGALNGTLSPDASVTGTLSSGPTISANLTIPSAIGVDPYQGEYRITPSTQTQTLNTSGKYLQNNVVVEPIPSNYGLITYNGSIITVS